MTGLEAPLALFLLLNLLVALIRVARGPTPADRMLAALLFGSTGVGVLLLLAHAGSAALSYAALVDVALVLALLAAITGVAFALRAWGRQGAAGPAPGDDGTDATKGRPMGPHGASHERGD